MQRILSYYIGTKEKYCKLEIKVSDPVLAKKPDYIFGDVSLLS